MYHSWKPLFTDSLAVCGLGLLQTQQPSGIDCLAAKFPALELGVAFCTGSPPSWFDQCWRADGAESHQSYSPRLLPFIVTLYTSSAPTHSRTGCLHVHRCCMSAARDAHSNRHSDRCQLECKHYWWADRRQAGRPGSVYDDRVAHLRLPCRRRPAQIAPGSVECSRYEWPAASIRQSSCPASNREYSQATSTGTALCQQSRAVEAGLRNTSNAAGEAAPQGHQL